MAWLTNYSYRKSITLSRASGAVTNYQMKLLVGETSGATGEDVDCGGLCLSTFNDIRFTKSDGTTLLDYWIESISGATPNQLATIWIEFDSIGTDATTFYMYYGKTDAPAASNGANTWAFFDDFTSLDNWTTVDGEPSIGSSIVILSPQTTIKRTTTGPVYPLKMVIRAKFSAKTITDYWIGIEFARDTDKNYNCGFMTVADKFYKNSYDGAVGSVEITNYADNAYHTFFTGIVASDYAKFIVDNMDEGTLTTHIPSNANDIWFVNHPTSSSGQTLYVDWVAIGTFQQVEPAWGAWGTQENEGSETIESAATTDSMVGESQIEFTTESASASDLMEALLLVDSISESAVASDAFGDERTAYGPTTESAEATDTMDALHLVDYTTESAVALGLMESADMIRKRIRFPNLQGKHLSLKFESATDGSFALYYLRHKMFKTRELTSDQKHPNAQASHISLKLSNSGSDAFTLMYVSEKMQVVTT